MGSSWGVSVAGAITAVVVHACIHMGMSTMLHRRERRIMFVVVTDGDG